jgi:hypothetical protein
MFRQDFSCPALLEDLSSHYPYGAITHNALLSRQVPVVSLKPLA